ncbi:MAG: hypothetical protein ACK5UC_25870 [Planctomycetaceae bacterium]
MRRFCPPSADRSLEFPPWDHRNRLTSITTFSATGTRQSGVEYTYDLYDRRIARKVDADGNGVFETTQRFVYDGEDLILAFSGSTNVLTNRYLYGPARPTRSCPTKRSPPALPGRSPGASATNSAPSATWCNSTPPPARPV